MHAHEWRKHAHLCMGALFALHRRPTDRPCLPAAEGALMEHVRRSACMQCNAMQCIQPRLLQDWVTLTREESEDAIVAECTARDALNLPSWCLSPYAHAAATLCTLTGIGIAAIRDGHGHGHRDRPETITCTHARLHEHACTENASTMH